LPISTISMSFVGSLSRSVAAHGDELALRLFVTNELQLRLRRRLGEKIIDPRLGCDRRRRQRIVAGDHHRPDAHPAQLAEALSDASLDDILQMDDPEQTAILRDGERRSTGFRDSVGAHVQGVNCRVGYQGTRNRDGAVRRLRGYSVS